jgi:hypothetical protein
VTPPNTDSNDLARWWEMKYLLLSVARSFNVGRHLLKHLDHRDPRIALVGNLRLATKTHDFRVLDHG